MFSRSSSAARTGRRLRLVCPQDAPILWITYAEVKFIEAEAAFRANNPSRAYDAYMDDPAVDVGQGNLTLDLIFKEKNVAMFLNPEAWVDHRRHDYNYPDFEPPVDQNPELDTEHIRRSLYPLSEIERNLANVPEVSMDQFLWWDQS